jgi:hypothetical protein
LYGFAPRQFLLDDVDDQVRSNASPHKTVGHKQSASSLHGLVQLFEIGEREMDGSAIAPAFAPAQARPIEMLDCLAVYLPLISRRQKCGQPCGIMDAVGCRFVMARLRQYCARAKDQPALFEGGSPSDISQFFAHAP